MTHRKDDIHCSQSSVGCSGVETTRFYYVLILRDWRFDARYNETPSTIDLSIPPLISIARVRNFSRLDTINDGRNAPAIVELINDAG